MKYTIKDTKYIKDGNIVIDYLKTFETKLGITEMLIRGLGNKELITKDTVFEFEDMFKFSNNDKYEYFVLGNGKIGAVIVREDNVELINDTLDVLDRLGIKRVIKNNDKTILITKHNTKFITTRHSEDTDDNEKAVMLVLLKLCGIKYKDIKPIADSWNTKQKATKEVKQERKTTKRKTTV